jgi:hypothetical protein
LSFLLLHFVGTPPSRPRERPASQQTSSDHSPEPQDCLCLLCVHLCVEAALCPRLWAQLARLPGERTHVRTPAQPGRQRSKSEKGSGSHRYEKRRTKEGVGSRGRVEGWWSLRYGEQEGDSRRSAGSDGADPLGRVSRNDQHQHKHKPDSLSILKSLLSTVVIDMFSTVSHLAPFVSQLARHGTVRAHIRFSSRAVAFPLTCNCSSSVSESTPFSSRPSSRDSSEPQVSRTLTPNALEARSPPAAQAHPTVGLALYAPLPFPVLPSPRSRTRTSGVRARDQLPS